MDIVKSLAKSVDKCCEKYDEIKQNNNFLKRVDRSIKLVNAYNDLGPGTIKTGPLEFQVYQESDRLRNEQALEQIKKLEKSPLEKSTE